METKKSAGRVCAQMGKKGVIEFDFDLSVFRTPGRTYDHALCRLACMLSTAGYDRVVEDPEAAAENGCAYTQPGLAEILDGMGFTRREIMPTAARDEESYFFAVRQLSLDGVTYDLYVAALIGSYKKTWFSNFDPLGWDRVCNHGMGYAGETESGVIHLGFADARDYVFMKLRDFMLRTRTGNPIKLLVTGHSRGAAAANLLSMKLLTLGGCGEGLLIAPENLYTYAFATPNYANAARVDLKDPRYGGIFNIVSPEDFVTEVFPKASGYGKVGTVYALLGPENRSREDYARQKAVMTRFFRGYRTSRPYASYKDGSRSVQKVIRVMVEELPDITAYYTMELRLCGRPCTAYEYFRITLCSFVGGNDSPEDRANIDRAQKLLVASAGDHVGTSRLFRKLSTFFVLKQGLAGVTGGKLGGEYFNDAHISETYLAYLMSMREDQLIREQ